MKKFSILLVALLVVNGAIGQSDHPCVPCLPQGITFTTQSQIDSFPINYPNCTQIEGNVQIGPTFSTSDITNLNGLNNITSIGGSFIIGSNYGGNPNLYNLQGLENLTLIGGGLLIMYTELSSLSGLENLSSTGGLHIDRCYSLTNLLGLENLNSIGESFWITENYGLTSLTGLESLTSIGESFFIYDTPINNFAALVNLCSIGNGLDISGDIPLTSFVGLDNLASIGGAIKINWNPSLTSLTGLDNIDADSITNLTITHNNSLCNCAVQSICDYLVSPNGTIEIHDNATGCNNQQEVEDVCAVIGMESKTPVSSLSIYPNPTSSYITITISTKGDLYIHNISGQQLLQREITEPRTTIDVSGFKSGIYFVRITGVKNVSVGKFIKQ